MRQTIEATHASRDNGVGIAGNISVPVVGPTNIVDLHSHTDDVLYISWDKPEPDRPKDIFTKMEETEMEDILEDITCQICTQLSRNSPWMVPFQNGHHY